MSSNTFPGVHKWHETYRLYGFIKAQAPLKDLQFNIIKHVWKVEEKNFLTSSFKPAAIWFMLQRL